jgi:hypothetical protein
MTRQRHAFAPVSLPVPRSPAEARWSGSCSVAAPCRSAWARGPPASPPLWPRLSALAPRSTTRRPRGRSRRGGRAPRRTGRRRPRWAPQGRGLQARRGEERRECYSLTWDWGGLRAERRFVYEVAFAANDAHRNGGVWNADTPVPCVRDYPTPKPEIVSLVTRFHTILMHDERR